MSPHGPVAVMSDGTCEQGTIVVGADGNGSAVRRWLLGDLAEPEVLPVQMLNITMQYSAEKALFLDRVTHPVVDVGVHPQKSMYMAVLVLDKPDHSKPETWSFYLLASWPDSFKVPGDESKSRLEQLRARLDNWAEPYKSAGSWIPDGTDIKPDTVKIWSPVPWDNRQGRVTLAGDAAHSMTWRKLDPT